MAIPRRPLVLTITVVLAVTGSCVLLTLPTTTKQGINYRVSELRIPLYVKAIEFLQRNFEYELLASRICAGKTVGADCIAALFEWTHANIPPTPAGWRVVDDHVLNIIIRGHGKSDQIADVFTTLSTYAGTPAFFTRVVDPDGGADLILSFARVDGTWAVFDVERHVAFRDSRGRLIDVDALVNDPMLVDAGTKGILPNGQRYSTFISRKTLTPFVPPRWSHADLQRPWPRVGYEATRIIGWVGGAHQ